MKSFVVEVRRYGELVFAGNYMADSLRKAVAFAGSEYLHVSSSQIILDRLGSRFNSGWTCYSVVSPSGYRLLVQEA